MYKKIILAYDGTEVGQQALLDCKDLAQWSHSKLWLIAVRHSSMNLIAIDAGIYEPDLVERDAAKFDAILRKGLSQLVDSGYEAYGEVLVGESVDELTKYARKVDANLIVVGHKHFEGWSARLWNGSFATSLIQHAPCSVLCVVVP
jgi:nucleotide-binding universal stress UspA family protein